MENNIRPGDIRTFLKALREDYVYKTLVSAGASFACTALFCVVPWVSWAALFIRLAFQHLCILFSSYADSGQHFADGKKNQGLPETEKGFPATGPFSSALP